VDYDNRVWKIDATEVPTAFSGQGIATDLAFSTFELLRQSKREAILYPFMMHSTRSTRNTLTSTSACRGGNDAYALVHDDDKAFDASASQQRRAPMPALALWALNVDWPVN
jgi:hypothetical protein